MSLNFSKIDQLVSDFESGLPVGSLLVDINSDEHLLSEWCYEHFDNSDFFFVIHENDIFITDDEITDYFESEYLLQMDGDQVAEFVYMRIESCIDDGNLAAVNFCQIDDSYLSAIGESRGQAGIVFLDFDITTSQSERFQKLLDQGYLFLPNNYFVIDEALLIEKYKKLIRDRLTQPIGTNSHSTQ